MTVRDVWVRRVRTDLTKRWKTWRLLFDWTIVLYGGIPLTFFLGYQYVAMWQSAYPWLMDVPMLAWAAGLLLIQLHDHFFAWIERYATVVIGTGVGGAFVDKQAVMIGSHFHGGEFGYWILDPSLPHPDGTWSKIGATAALVQRCSDRCLDKTSLRSKPTLPFKKSWSVSIVGTRLAYTISNSASTRNAS